MAAASTDGLERIRVVVLAGRGRKGFRWSKVSMTDTGVGLVRCVFGLVDGEY